MRVFGLAVLAKCAAKIYRVQKKNYPQGSNYFTNSVFPGHCGKNLSAIPYRKRSVFEPLSDEDCMFGRSFSMPFRCWPLSWPSFADLSAVLKRGLPEKVEFAMDGPRLRFDKSTIIASAAA